MTHDTRSARVRAEDAYHDILRATWRPPTREFVAALNAVSHGLDEPPSPGDPDDNQLERWRDTLIAHYVDLGNVEARRLITQVFPD